MMLESSRLLSAWRVVQVQAAHTEVRAVPPTSRSDWTPASIPSIVVVAGTTTMLAFCRRYFLLSLLHVLVLAVATAGCSGGIRPSLDASTIDSTATLVVGDLTYTLKVACYTFGEDLTAVGIGTDAATGPAAGTGPATAHRRVRPAGAGRVERPGCGGPVPRFGDPRRPSR